MPFAALGMSLTLQLVSSAEHLELKGHIVDRPVSQFLTVSTAKVDTLYRNHGGSDTKHIAHQFDCTSI